MLGTFGLISKVGEYPEESKKIPDLNHPKCGVGMAPGYYVRSFNKNCFKNAYPSRTIVDYVSVTDVEGQPSNRIFNGRDAKKGEAPWAVHIETTIAKNPDSHGHAQDISYIRCTGALLNFEWVITVAHCVDKGYSSFC